MVPEKDSHPLFARCCPGLTPAWTPLGYSSCIPFTDQFGTTGSEFREAQTRHKTEFGKHKTEFGKHKTEFDKI